MQRSQPSQRSDDAVKKPGHDGEDTLRWRDDEHENMQGRVTVAGQVDATGRQRRRRAERSKCSLHSNTSVDRR